MSGGGRTPVGEWGVSVARRIVVPLLRVALVSVLQAQAGGSPSLARAGALGSSLRPWWGN